MARNIKNHFPHQFKSGKNCFDQLPVLNTLSCQIPSVNSPIITGFLCRVEEVLANERCLNYLWSLNKPGSSETSQCAQQTFLRYQASTPPFTGLKPYIVNGHTGENQIQISNQNCKMLLGKSCDSLRQLVGQSVSLKSLWIPLRLMSSPCHILLGWEPGSDDVKANNRLLNSALCRFRYPIMSPCFSTISSRLEIVLNPVSEAILQG